MKKSLFILVILAFLMIGCSPAANESTPAPRPQGMGMGNGMMARHHADIPAEFVGLENPVAVDEASLVRGAEVYTAQCATCHGDGGMGDGPAGEALDPKPAPVSQTSLHMTDGYLFWRISAGGAAFSSAMPAWDTLDESSRWDVINYMRALGQGTVEPANHMGGASFDPQVQAAHQAEMLATAVAQGVITQEEAGIFTIVHDALETFRTDEPAVAGATTDEREAAMLAELVNSKVITQVQANAFKGIHDRIGAAGLMP